MINAIYLVYIILSMIFFIYNLVCFITKKPIIYIKSKNKKTIILNDDFFKTQLIFSIINSILLIINSIIFMMYFYKYILMYISISLFIFILINYLIKSISIKKEYIDLV